MASPSLNPLYSPASPQAFGLGHISAQNATQTPESMAKPKRRMFSTPLLRRSATASSAAAASAASKLKSNLSTVTKLPTALKRTSASCGHKAPVDRESMIQSFSRSSTASEKQQSRKFGLPSLMRVKTASKDVKAADSSEENSSRGNNSENEADTIDMAMSTARFVMGMPAMLRRAVSNNQAQPSANAAAPQKQSPDTSANSTPQGNSPHDNWDENDRYSLLMMIQVPEAQRQSQIPLMAAGGAW